MRTGGDDSTGNVNSHYEHRVCSASGGRICSIIMCALIPAGFFSQVAASRDTWEQEGDEKPLGAGSY